MISRAFVLTASLIAPLLAAAPEPVSSAAGPSPGTASAEHGYSLSAYAALGSRLAATTRLTALGWSEAQIAAFLDGENAAFHGHPDPATDEARALHDQIETTLSAFERQHRRELLETDLGREQFIAAARKSHNLRESDSGLCFRIDKGGSGVRARPQDTVVVSFQCMTADDMQPVPHMGGDHLRVKVSDLLPGLAEGIQMMSTDGQATFLVPPELAFPSAQWPAGVPRIPLVFTVALHDVVPAQQR